jgi:peroxiredoxin
MLVVRVGYVTRTNIKHRKSIIENQLIKMLKKLLISLCCCFLALNAFSQGYKIDGRIRGLKDSTCYLTYYYENQNFIQDTTVASSDGTIVFKGKTPLKGGMYNVMIGHWQSFDLLITNQSFSFEANVKDIFNTLKFFGSRENDLFYSYQQKTSKDSKLVENLIKKSDTASVNKLYSIQNESVLYKKKFIKAFEGSFASNIIKSTLASDIPPAPKMPNGENDPLWGNKFFVEHYFDNIDLTDDRLINSPFLYQPVKYYFDQLEFLPNDSLIVLTDKFLNKSRKTSPMRKYLVSKLANQLETSKVMGRDAVFYHLLQKYYVNDPLLWDTTTVRLVKERVKYLKNVLIGSKIPNLKATDVNGKERALYDVKSPFTVLYIYAADCAHCKNFTPQLVKFIQANNAKGVEVFAPIFGNNVETWKAFIKEFGSEPFINVIDKTGKVNLYQEFDAQFTPTIYILDKDKKIIGKGNMNIETLKEIIFQ